MLTKEHFLFYHEQEDYISLILKVICVGVKVGKAPCLHVDAFNQESMSMCHTYTFKATSLKYDLNLMN